MPSPPPPAAQQASATAAPGHGHASLAAQGNASNGPQLTRRSSYEPMRLGALPPPVFSRAPPGQRSVPAIEFLTSSVKNGDGEPLATLPGSGTNTPAIPALGNGALSVEPWNLWSDSSAPSAKAAADATTDDQLANALAAASILDVSKPLSRAGSLNTKTKPIATIPASSWPEEFKTTSETSAQPFALDPSASPDRVKNAPSADVANKSSLLPRNVSFSALLDLPSSAPGSEKSNYATSDGARSGSPLARKSSLASRSTAQTSPTSTRTSGLPSTSEGYGVPAFAYNGNSTANNGRVAGTRTGPSSPVQSRDSSAAFGPPGGMPNVQAGMRGNPMLRGMDFQYLNDDSDVSSLGIRSRQPSAFSDTGSITSLPFGPAFAMAIGGRQHGTPDSGYGDPNSFGSFGPNASANSSIFGNAQPGYRRDSGYGASPYTNANNGFGPGQQQRRSWGMQNGPFSSPSAGQGANRNSLYGGITDHPFPGPAPYITAENSSPFGISSAPSVHSSSSSLYRYGGGAHDYLSPGAAALQGYGLGMVGPASPFVPIGIHGAYESRLPRDDKPRVIRSPLLEEFRADKTRRWGVQDMTAHIAEFMCDQVGSRYIQEHILEHPSLDDCDRIYEEVYPVMLQLSTDVFANFCVQKLLEKARTEHAEKLVKALKGSILMLSLQTYGCRVIQKSIEVASPDTQLMIVRELNGSVHKCVRDQNANHVVQKVVQTVPADQLQFIVDAFVGHVYTFATHPYSCRVLQRILENCPERMTRPLLEELKSYAQNLMQDQYGNYVVQFVLEKGLPQDKSDIIVQIYGQVLHLAKHKFASNVIEKCIMNATENEILMLAGEVLAPRHDGSTGIVTMLKHEYANYPLQRLIKHTTGSLHAAIVDQVTLCLSMFRSMVPPYTAKHLAAVEKLLVDLSPEGFPTLLPRRYEDHYITRR